MVLALYLPILDTPLAMRCIKESHVVQYQLMKVRENHWFTIHVSSKRLDWLIANAVQRRLHTLYQLCRGSL